MSPWLAVPLVLALLAASMVLLSAGALPASEGSESRRKLLHIEMGVVTLGFPWWFPAAWPVLVLAALALAWFAALRASRRLGSRFAPVLACRGESLGEVWFTLGVCATFVLSAGDPVRYSVAILVLAFADAAAALVGRRFGRPRRMPGGACKSAAGSAAFFVAAFAIAFAVLLLAGALPAREALRAAALVAALTALLEALLGKGLDNLFVPLGALAALELAQIP